MAVQLGCFIADRVIPSLLRGCEGAYNRLMQRRKHSGSTEEDLSLPYFPAGGARLPLASYAGTLFEEDKLWGVLRPLPGVMLWVAIGLCFVLPSTAPWAVALITFGSIGQCIMTMLFSLAYTYVGFKRMERAMMNPVTIPPLPSRPARGGRTGTYDGATLHLPLSPHAGSGGGGGSGGGASPVGGESTNSVSASASAGTGNPALGSGAGAGSSGAAGAEVISSSGGGGGGGGEGAAGSGGNGEGGASGAASSLQRGAAASSSSSSSSSSGGGGGGGGSAVGSSSSGVGAGAGAGASSSSTGVTKARGGGAGSSAPLAFPLAESQLHAAEVVHLIAICRCTEPIDVLEDVLDLLSAHSNRGQYVVLACLEARDPHAVSVGESLVLRYGARFKRVMFAVHPGGVEGEVPGKSSNVNFGVRAAHAALEAEWGGRAMEAIVVTCADCDAKISEHYFNELSVRFAASVRERRETFFAPPTLFDLESAEAAAAAAAAEAEADLKASGGAVARDLLATLLGQGGACIVRSLLGHVIPGPVKIADQMWSILVLQQLASSNWVRLPCSTYSVGLKLMASVGYWDTGVESVPEDYHTGLKLYWLTGGRARCEPIFHPVLYQHIDGGTWVGTAHQRFQQGVRHMWGATDMAFVLWCVLRVPGVPLLAQVRMVATVIDAHVSTCASAFLSTFAMPLLALLRPGYFGTPLGSLLLTVHIHSIYALIAITLCTGAVYEWYAGEMVRVCKRGPGASDEVPVQYTYLVGAGGGVGAGAGAAPAPGSAGALAAEPTAALAGASAAAAAAAAASSAAAAAAAAATAVASSGGATGGAGAAPAAPALAAALAAPGASATSAGSGASAPAMALGGGGGAAAAAAAASSSSGSGSGSGSPSPPTPSAASHAPGAFSPALPPLSHVQSLAALGEAAGGRVPAPPPPPQPRDASGSCTSTALGTLPSRDRSVLGRLRSGAVTYATAADYALRMLPWAWAPITAVVYMLAPAAMAQTKLMFQNRMRKAHVSPKSSPTPVATPRPGAATPSGLGSSGSGSGGGGGGGAADSPTQMQQVIHALEAFAPSARMVKLQLPAALTFGRRAED